MANTDLIQDIVRANHGYTTSAEVDSRGIQSWYLSDMVKRGSLIRVSRGLYASPNDPFIDDDFRFQLRYSKYIYSFQSALYYHGLTDRIPMKREVTAFKGYHPSTSVVDAIVHYVMPRFYEIGITETKTGFGNTVRVYDMERTICDLILHRDSIDAEIFIKAMKTYAKNPKKNTISLFMIAEVFGISKEVYQIFEVIYG